MIVLLATLLALGGWIVPWQHDAGMASVARAKGEVQDVFLFAARLDPEGHVVLDDRGKGWKDTTSRVHANEARVWLTVVNDVVPGAGSASLKDSDVVSRMMHDDALRARQRSEIIQLATSLGVYGVDVDYENLPSAERDAFTVFARELTSELRNSGLASSITVQPKTGESSSRGPGAMDWPKLCEAADRVQVMLYNEHNASTGPGPIASPSWIGSVADYGLTVCPAAKLVPVLKVSGMDWGPSKAEWRSFGEVAAIMDAHGARPKRGWSTSVPWFVYNDPDGRHVVYYEDARSLAAKAEKLAARGLGSIVLWSLGSEDPEAIARLRRVSVAQKR